METVAAPPDPTDPTDSATRRLLLVFTSPERVFAAIARKPTLVVILVALVLGSILTQIPILAKMDIEGAIRAELAGKNSMPEDQLESMMPMMKAMAWIGPAVTVVLLPLMMSVIAGLFFLLLRIAGSKAEYRKILSGVCHAFWPPSLVGGVVLAAVALTRSTITAEDAKHLVKSSPGAFLPAESNPAFVSLLTSLDLFSIWTVVLLVLALAVIGGVSRAKSAAIVVGCWWVYIVLKMGGATMLALLNG